MSIKTVGRWVAILLAVVMTGVLATPVAAISDDGPPPAPELSADRYVVVMEEVPNVTEFGQDAVNSPAAEARSDELTESHDDAAAAAGVGQSAIATTTPPPSTGSRPS